MIKPTPAQLCALGKIKPVAAWKLDMHFCLLAGTSWFSVQKNGINVARIYGKENITAFREFIGRTLELTEAEGLTRTIGNKNIFIINERLTTDFSIGGIGPLHFSKPILAEVHDWLTATAGLLPKRSADYTDRQYHPAVDLDGDNLRLCLRYNSAASLPHVTETLLPEEAAKVRSLLLSACGASNGEDFEYHSQRTGATIQVNAGGGHYTQELYISTHWGSGLCETSNLELALLAVDLEQ